MVMLLAGRIREDKVEVETARGDGPLLPIAELPTAVVQAQGKVRRGVNDKAAVTAAAARVGGGGGDGLLFMYIYIY